MVDIAKILEFVRENRGTALALAIILALTTIVLLTGVSFHTVHETTSYNFHTVANHSSTQVTCYEVADTTGESTHPKVSFNVNGQDLLKAVKYEEKPKSS